GSTVADSVSERFNTFNHYFSVKQNITTYDSLLHPGMYKRVYADSTDSLRWARADSLKAAQDSAALLASNLQSGGVLSDSSHPGHRNPNDTVNHAPSSVVSRDTIPGQSNALDTTAQNKFKPPDVSNSEVSRLIPPNERSGGKGALLGDEDIGRARNLRLAKLGDTSKAGRDTTKQGKSVRKNTVLTPDTLRYLIVKSKFELAGVFFLEMKMLDSAEATYQGVIDDSTQTPFIPGAYYAIGEIHRAQRDTVFADSLDRMIVEKYPKTEYARSIRKTRGEIVADEKNMAAEKYADAMKLLDETKTMEAIALLDSVVQNYDSSSFAPKAEYTIGWIYENVLVQNDSAEAHYKILIKDYPTSIYALEANPKVAVKEDPKTLSQYVKVKEIALVQKTSRAKSGKSSSKSKASANKAESLGIQTHGKDRDANLDPDEDDDDATSSDENTNTN
ncbi:MAG TPA: tetratricopeptide repeat protein, partial [Bacteroidota bacterium]|nr:tetratricopeptide repeat protein [Bacteroidota bacterium]